MPDPDSVHPAGPDEVITDVISEFSQVFAFARRSWARYANDVHGDLNPAGVMVLHTVLRMGSVTATEIGKGLDMDKAVVSRQIAKLRELELIRTEPAEEDRRVVLIMATELAEHQIETLRARWAHDYRERFEGWTSEDLESLRNSLRRFNDSAPSARDLGPAERCGRSRSEPSAEARTESSTEG